MQQSFSIDQAQTQIQVNSFIRSVYNWMSIGLAITGLVAFFVSNNATLQSLIFGTPLFYVLIFAELGLVWTISARVRTNRMQASTATGLFMLYAGLNGATLSAILLMYASATVAQAFFITAATFFACSVYGMVTKKDLTGVGQFMFMGLIGIVIATIANIFFRSSGLQMIISYLGVFIFVGLTAYDTQKLKMMALTQPADLDGATIQKGAILGALTLYLDFINMFIFIVHILGGSRD
ncbi:Bax inhibitor-1/YccA family protein [Desulfobacterales bacterium HSG17]|nr:Bax inhibitor-1/YccA family protein [Desulfobacterales bacterium HSG17]